MRPTGVRALVVGMGCLLIGLALTSLGRPMYQDAPIMLYTGFLLDQVGLVPYRDFFDMNTPGAYFANVLIGRASGYTEAGVRVVDLVLLAAVLRITWSVMAPFGREAAALATTGTGAVYLACGPYLSLQREHLLVALTVMAVAIVLRPWSALARTAGVGLLLGLATTIKPHALLLVVPFGWYLDRDAPDRRRRFGMLGALMTAWALPVVATVVYLYRADAWPAFVEMTTEYWPLYNAVSGERPHYVLHGPERLVYTLRGLFTFGPHPGLPLAIVGALGAFVALRRSDLSAAEQRVVWLLVAVTGTFWIYVGVGGKFWLHHWWPFCYSAILLASLGLNDRRGRLKRITVPALCAGLLGAIPWVYVGPLSDPRFPFEEVRGIARYLSERLEPGDTVVPLDWIEGAVHAMLLARARPGTPFLYDFHFHHHTSSDYTQRLRSRFLTRLEQEQPRFVVRIDRPERFDGPDTSRRFAELEAWLGAGYDVVVNRTSYQILERRRSAATVASPPTSGWPPSRETPG